jgi:hypothetical protein
MSDNLLTGGGGGGGGSKTIWLARKLRTLYYNKYSLVYIVALKKCTAKKFPLNGLDNSEIKHLLICRGIAN